MAKLGHHATDCFNTPEFDRISAAFINRHVFFGNPMTRWPVFLASTSAINGLLEVTPPDRRWRQAGRQARERSDQIKGTVTRVVRASGPYGNSCGARKSNE